MLENDHSLLVGEYHDKLATLVNSPLFECLKLMPKPAVHHAHLTACASVDYLLSLTYKDCVYYSKRNNDFHVSALGCDKEGYIKVNTLRQYWKKGSDFDSWLRAKMELRPARSSREDHKIWEDFEPKFVLCYNLYHYKPFFERILYEVTKKFVEEMVTVVEYRHIIGGVFDDYGNKLSLEEELKIFKDCVRLM